MAAKEKKALGTGLDVLFGSDDWDDQNSELLVIPIEKVEPRKEQPRETFNQEALEELSDSIAQYGLIQPIVARKLESGYYQIIAGERRWRASRMAGLTEVPVRVIEADDRRTAELALVENLQREDLNPIEEARGYQTLMREYGLTQEDAAAAVGKSRPAVANALRLLNLPDATLTLVEDGTLSAGHARALLPIRDENAQRQAAQTVIDKHLSVRQTEALAARLARAPADTTPSRQTPNVDYVREVERELEAALGRKVRLVDGKNRGRIELEFYGAEDREKLIGNLKLFSSLRRNK